MPVGMWGRGEAIALTTRAPKIEGGDRAYDPYGVLLYVGKTVTVMNVAVYPESASEVGQGNERTNTVYVCVLPTDVAVDASDVIRWRGKDYEVQGEAEHYQSPMTGTSHQTVRMARVEG